MKLLSFEELQNIESIETQTVFPKTEMNNEWNINFLENNVMNAKETNSSEFSTG